MSFKRDTALSAVKVRSQGSKSKTESSLAHLETAFHCFQISVEVKPLWEEKRGGEERKEPTLTPAVHAHNLLRNSVFLSPALVTGTAAEEGLVHTVLTFGA